VLKLSADVAEARLQVKFSQAAKSAARPVPAAPRVEPVEAEPFTIEINVDPPPSSAPSAAAESAPELEDAAEEPLATASETSPEEIAGRNALATMKHCFQTFTKSAGDLGLLRELHAQIEAFAESARISGYVALHRLSSAFASFVLELHKYPELLNQASFRTISGTMDFLGVLLKQKDYAALKDPATALVYAVDDELDNCEAIRMGMETVMLRTQSVQDPAVALTQLPHERCDLIFLDVSMPQMSGFELCQRLRQTPMHARTPIVFLTGMTTIENRVQSSLSGGNDMIGKPFNLAELSLKALTLILRSSLNME
jgi:CheY-like chemotaxis protein